MAELAMSASSRQAPFPQVLNESNVMGHDGDCIPPFHTDRPRARTDSGDTTTTIPRISSAAVIERGPRKDTLTSMLSKWVSHQFSDSTEDISVGGLKEYKGSLTFSNLNVTIREDGGVGKVGTLWSCERYVYAVSLCCFALLNAGFIIQRAHVVTTDRAWECTSEINRHYMLINRMLDWSVPRWCYRFKGTVFVASFEMIVLTCKFAWVMWYTYRIMTVTTDERLVMWWCVYRICCGLIPDLAGLSAVKLLKDVAPSVLARDLNQKFGSARERRWRKYGLPLLVFALSRLFYLVVGFDAFAVKVYIAGELMKHGSNLDIFLGMVVFLNQMLSIVRVSDFALERLCVFVFGGGDSVMNHDEKLKKKQWQARLTQEVFRSFPWWQAIAIMLTYSDVDFQEIVLEPHQGTGGAYGVPPAGRRSLSTIAENADVPVSTMHGASS